MAKQLEKVVTTKLAKELNLKGLSGQALEDAVLDVGHTGKPSEAKKRAFDLLSQHLDTQGKVPITIKADSGGYPRVEVAGFDPAKTKMLKDRLEYDSAFFDEAVDALAKNKGQPVQKLQAVSPEFQRGVIPEDLDFYTKKEFSDPKSSIAWPQFDAWLQRTQADSRPVEVGKNLLGSFFGRGYNEAAQNWITDPNRFYAGSRFTNWSADKVAKIGDWVVSVPTVATGIGGGVMYGLEKGRMAKQEAQHDILNQNAVVAGQEKLLRQGLGEGHISSADWSDRESTNQYTKNSKYANRWVLQDAFSDVIKSNYGGKLKRLYQSDATEALQSLRKAYSERVKGLPNGKIARFNDKGLPIMGKNGPEMDDVDLKKFEQGIETEGGVFVPVQDRASEDMQNRGILAKDGKRYVAMLYAPSKNARSTISKAKEEVKKKDAEGKPVEKVKTRSEIAAELDKGKSDEEPAAQWVFINVSEKGTKAIYRDADGNPSKPEFE